MTSACEFCRYSVTIAATRFGGSAFLSPARLAERPSHASAQTAPTKRIECGMRSAECEAIKAPHASLLLLRIPHSALRILQLLLGFVGAVTGHTVHRLLEPIFVVVLD